MINFSIIEKVSGDKYYEYIIILAPPQKETELSKADSQSLSVLCFIS